MKNNNPTPARVQTTEPQATSPLWLHDFDELDRLLVDLEWRRSAVGMINPRPAGLHNDLIQLAKKTLARLFDWHTRPQDEFNAQVIRSVQEISRALEDLSINTVSLEWRLAQLQKKADLASAESAYANLPRTTYVIGLFGSGRQYVMGLILQNIGERARYFRDGIRLHPGPTPMIYSGHATIKHACRAQHLPPVTSGVLHAVAAGFAHLIFVYRHPLDSVLTNWVWWRAYVRDNLKITGITAVYKDTDALCADLEENFSDFKAFAEGSPHYFTDIPGTRFLSLREFVEETELYLQAATLTLRFEDFMVDPSRQFSDIVELMSIDCDVSRLSLDPPMTKPYGYLTVKEKVPRFREFINGLDEETKGRIERIGYGLEG